MNFKCYFIGGPLDGMTMVKVNMSDIVECMNEPLKHYNDVSELPPTPIAPAPKIGRYRFVDELKTNDIYPPIYRRMIMGWEG